MRDAFVFYIIGSRYNAGHYNIILDTIRKEESKKQSSDYELTKYITYLDLSSEVYVVFSELFGERYRDIERMFVL